MKLYAKFFSMHLKSIMQYKVSFFLTMMGQVAASFSVFLGVSFMFGRFSTLEGFTYPQVLLCCAVVMMAFSLAECFGRGFDMFPSLITTGGLDRLLVRPRGIVFQVLASQLELTRIGRAAQAVVMLAYALPRSGVVWTADKMLTLALMIICGSLIFFALFLVFAAFSFFTIEGLEFMNIFTDGGREFGRYPFAAYGEKVLRILTYFIPLALFQYYPLLYLLDMETGLLYMFAPVLGLLFLAPCYVFWRFGLSKYKSAGS